MCGLTSIFFPDEVSAPSGQDLEKCLEESLELIKHRGPDSRGTYLSPDNRVGLGHVRLSIIDLSTGQQPLSDEDKLIHCVVTGEIYDHERIRDELQSQGYSFKSKSDSELVVQLYKRDGFNMLFHLRGEFAFVLYDLKRRLLFVARDRFGIKPLYYTVDNGRILFASEMKAFMGLGWKAEWDIDSIVHSGELGDDRTVFKGVKKFPAGNFAVCRASGYINVQPYWDLSYPTASALPSSTIETMISTVREHLVEAVRLRLRSDVPLAVYLSGGIDSSAVAGIATHLLRQNNPDAKLNTFTLAYPEDETTDESPIAARTAAHIGANMHVVNATEAKLVGALEDAIWHSEQPNTTFHGAGKILMSRAVHGEGFKVVLSGEGSDEVMAGYGWFPIDYLRDADPAGAALGLKLPSDEERREMVADLEKNTGIPQLSSVATRLDHSKDLLNISAHHVATIMAPFYYAMFHPDVVQKTGVPEIARCIAEGVDPRARLNSLNGNWHSLNVALYITAKSVLGKIILNFAGDRNDMINSVESRVSFLDHHLVEYINSLPPSVKIMPITDGSGKWTLTEKWILRQAVQPFVTKEIYLRKKAPFNPPPQPSSASGGLVPLQAHLKARITQTNVERLGFFDWKYIQEILDGYLNSPSFPAHGAVDQRARMLMGVLSFIVLQERFHVPTLNH
ncbi:putative asparagine synthase [Mycena rebaudengoi]|nr:putative asparagine synthase [Mycena rebaudengoi]